MKQFLLLMAFAVGLSASPINGGSCNGGGTLAEFAALSQGCNQGAFFVGIVSATDPAFLDLEVTFISENYSRFEYDIWINFVGQIPVGSFTFPITLNLNYPDFNPLPENYEFRRQWSLPALKGDTYTTSQTRVDADLSVRYVLLPEPASFALMATGIGLLALCRRATSICHPSRFSSILSTTAPPNQGCSKTGEGLD